MTEAPKRMPLFKYNEFLSPEQFNISQKIIRAVSFEFFQTSFVKLKGRRPDVLRKVDEDRWKVEKMMTRMKKKEKFGEDEFAGLRIATAIASKIDLIYYYKLKEYNQELLKESANLSSQISVLLGSESEFFHFFEKHKYWKQTLILIKDYASNQLRKNNFSKSINKRSSELAKKMGKTKGPQLYFLPLEEDPKVLGEKTEKRSFMPQLLFTLPIDETRYSHPLGITHHNLFYGFVMLQAGSALRWEQSAVAFDGGSLFLVNNFIGNYEKVIKKAMQVAEKRGIKINSDELWQIFADIILLHEIGHSNNFEKTDLNMGDWTEWLANTFMYKKSIDAIFQSMDLFEKIIFALMSQADLNKTRLKDPEAREYIDSELLFMHLLIKSGLINLTDFTFNRDPIKLAHLKESINECRKFEKLNEELLEIKKNKQNIINFWQKYFGDDDK